MLIKKKNILLPSVSFLLCVGLLLALRQRAMPQLHLRALFRHLRLNAELLR